jgi:L-amino acid N-acyltransferase YncA
VAESGRGRGVGSVLLSALIKTSEEQGFWTLQAGIFPIVGTRERIGQMNGWWRDVVLMERRKTIA